jgi:kynurenine formamidase
MPLSESMPRWPGSAGFSRWTTQDLVRGDGFTNSSITFDDIDLDRLVGPARVVELPGSARMTAEDLKGTSPGGTERLLLLVGNDYLSVQLFGGDPRTHTILMETGVAILEGVDLSEVAGGPDQLLCLPLGIRGAEAAPARAVLVEPAA